MRFPAQAEPDGSSLIVWRVFLSIEANGVYRPEVHVDVRQALDTHGQAGPLQVLHPPSYAMPWDAAVCEAQILDYLQGTRTSVGRGSTDTLQATRLLVRPASFEFSWSPARIPG